LARRPRRGPAPHTRGDVFCQDVTGQAPQNACTRCCYQSFSNTQDTYPLVKEHCLSPRRLTFSRGCGPESCGET